MKHVVILHKTSRLKFDLGDIADPRERTLHLITLDEGGVRVRPGDESMIDSVTTVPAWTYEHLREAMDKVVAGQDPADIQLVTHDEYSMMFAARLREVLGIAGAGVAQVRRFTHKPTMKAVLAGSGVRLPRYIQLADTSPGASPAAIADEVTTVTGLPAFAKEVAGTCSERAVRRDTRDDLIDWLTGLPDPGNFEVDEFLVGELLQVDSVIKDGRVAHVQTTLVSFPNAEAVGDRPLGALTIPPGSSLGRRLVAFNDRCLEALAPLIDGTTHLELFHTPSDELVFLEIAARSPGGDCPRLYEVNSGLNYQSVFFQLQLGLPVDVTATPGPHGAWLWYARQAGRVAELVDPQVSSPYELVHELAVGDVVSASADTRDRSARIFLTNEDFDTLLADFDHLRYRYQPFRYG